MEDIDDLPESVVRSLCGNPLWVADEGPHVVEPVGVLAGMPKAAWGTRASWLESLDWDRVARVLGGRHATPPGQKDPSEHRAQQLEAVGAWRR